MEPEAEIIAYKKADEIPILVEKALKDKSYHKKIASAGYRRVLAEHTYCHRLRKMIEIIKKKYT